MNIDEIVICRKFTHKEAQNAQFKHKPCVCLWMVREGLENKIVLLRNLYSK